MEYRVIPIVSALILAVSVSTTTYLGRRLLIGSMFFGVDVFADRFDVEAHFSGEGLGMVGTESRVFVVDVDLVHLQELMQFAFAIFQRPITVFRRGHVQIFRFFHAFLLLWAKGE